MSTLSTTKRVPTQSQVEFITSEVKKGSSKSSIIRTMYIQMVKDSHPSNHIMGDIMRGLDKVYPTPTKFQQVRNVLVTSKLR
jgi:hypothetical protein